MKTPRILLFAVLCCPLLLVAACAPAKYVPGANEELYGTWINQGLLIEKITVDAASLKEFNIPSNPEPNQQFALQIDRKWTDPQGNIWYQTEETVTGAYLKGSKHQMLHKLSKDGTVWESMGTWVDRFDAREFPAKIDPKQVSADPSWNPSSGYRIYYRAEK